MPNGNKAAQFHQDPEITVVSNREIPIGRLEHNRVDRRFWTNVINRLLLLPVGKSLRIKFNESAYTHTNTGCYVAAKRAGIKVSVTRSHHFAYIRRIHFPTN